MTVKLYPTPGEFLRDNRDFLHRYEVQAQLNCYNAARHRDAPCSPELFFGRVEQDNCPVLLFGNAHPHFLCLNAAPDDRRVPEAARELSGYLGENNIAIAGVSGRDNLCRAFMEAHGGDFALRSSMDIMVLEKLIEPPPCNGTVRRAGLSDLELIANWKCALIREAVGEEPEPQRVRSTTIGQLERSVVWLMENGAGEPVSMANSGRMLEGWACVSGVYTPPEHRGKGYCQVTVAALCRELLASGKGYITLFVDKKNPISNRVYRKIGFDILEDSSDYRLS